MKYMSIPRATKLDIINGITSHNRLRMAEIVTALD
jgi:hypothetical protein